MNFINKGNADNMGIELPITMKQAKELEKQKVQILELLCYKNYGVVKDLDAEGVKEGEATTKQAMRGTKLVKKR